MKQTFFAVAMSAALFTSGVALAQAGTGPMHPRGGMAPSDVNGDGVLSREEYLAQADRKFDRLDFNHDGRVSEETMVAAHKGARGPGMRGPGRREPDGWRGRGRGMRGPGMDRGPDGMTPPPPPPGAQNAPMTPEARMAAMRTKADERFRAVDTNHDGWLDRAEFRAAVSRRFDTLDANHDGKVDAAERESARMAMRDKLRGDMPPPPPAK